MQCLVLKKSCLTAGNHTMMVRKNTEKVVAEIPEDEFFYSKITELLYLVYDNKYFLIKNKHGLHISRYPGI